MTKLTGKAALVTGGSGGIGAAIAIRLAENGADVAITYSNSPDEANMAVDRIKGLGRKSIAISANGRTRGEAAAAVEQAVERLGQLDILVTAAGVFDIRELADIDDDSFDLSFDLHVRSVMEAAQAAVPLMKDGGSIVMIGSILGDIAPFPGLTLYTASKAAEAGFAKALARELGQSGITVNTVQPGPINTKMNPADPDANPAAAGQIAATAQGRYGNPEDIADTTAFLVSGGAKYITGQAINVDGGWTA